MPSELLPGLHEAVRILKEQYKAEHGCFFYLNERISELEKNPTDWKAARERVIKEYSDARCVPVLHKVDYEVKAWTTYWDYSVLGSGPTEAEAWIDAAERV